MCARRAQDQLSGQQPEILPMVNTRKLFLALALLYFVVLAMPG